MPVPIPVYTKQPAHPVIKINHLLQPDSESSIFQHLTHSLPLPPQGPPPSFATREEWISSLPSWRRNKPRRIWEDDSVHAKDRLPGFNEGLTVADNAPVIKGEPAQACIPPVRSASTQSYLDMYLPREEMEEDASGYPASMQDWQSEDEMCVADLSPVDQKYYSSIESPSGVTMDYPASTRVITRSYSAPGSTGAYPAYHRGAFSPVLEDFSPEVAENRSPEAAGGADLGSSPIGPETPFAEYVDHAVAQVQLVPALQSNRDTDERGASYVTHDSYHASCYQCQTYHAEQPVQQVPTVDSVVAPVATAAYKKLAAPLAEWMVGFVWKVCTTGMRLPSEYAQPMAFVKHFPSSPPSHLVVSTHSMLLSTLLQPSAVFLALWYIVRLPVFFGPVGLGSEHAKEMRFRAELLGEAHIGTGREAIEAYAPFRLILLGCMLANKWLDDHTFSNKTWHTISNIPIQSLNRLEALALEIFQYDLTIAPQEWSIWLSEIMAYHQSLSSPIFPQPISRPSASPHIIVRQAIDLLLTARPVECGCRDNDGQTCCTPPQPVFVGLEEPRKETVTDETFVDDVLEIDLDEDGPLREEYLPRRRIYAESAKALERALPPPAKWSPAGDEPIIRDNGRGHGQYVAPQAVPHLAMAPLPPLPPFPADVHRPSWPLGFVMRQEPITRPAVYAPPTVYQPPVPGFEYGYGVSVTQHSHTRSHSLSYNQAITEQVPGRLRSFSQTQFDHGYNDIHGIEAHYAPPPVSSHWATYDRIGFPTSYDRPLGLHPRPSLKA